MEELLSIFVLILLSWAFFSCACSESNGNSDYGGSDWGKFGDDYRKYRGSCSGGSGGGKGNGGNGASCGSCGGGCGGSS